VEPFIDPAAVRLARDGRAVPQPGQPRLGVGDGLQDLSQRTLALAYVMEVPCTPDPTCTRKSMPFSAMARASSEACGCAKPAGSDVEPGTGPDEMTGTVQL
jgi:hypothetical protein